ncbi:hypothetical protein J4050_07160 [Winogradskyella sp. DF17]|uniref:Uncharacterized protein n=1 Tax=Winogradskyella pelagia TaxID=2819984 RepID=A0ABS3T197_9FLAO|nr:hypothetical protein [Winogradskyella sp. DF17]MBO3116520.1 hypothetical protein [Winogradskyella sp. DF17]
MQKLKKKDKHPLAINILKLNRYNYDFFNCEEVVFFEYIVVKGMAFKKQKEFFHSSETIRQETGIKKHSLNSIIRRFKDLGIISTEIKGMPRVKFFTVHYPKIVDLIPKIYQLSNNGQLSSDFSKHLSDFFIPLVDNYLQKNNIKNNKEEINKKEKYNSESEGEDVLSFFNDYLASLKYQKNISPTALKFNDIDLFRALKNYEIEFLCEYLEKYFEEEHRPSLNKFFAFDSIAVNKLKYIEQKIVDENDYVEQMVDELQRIYNKRIEMYNKDDDYSRAKSKTKLVVTKRIKQQLKTALKYRNELQITHSFTAYADDLLKGNLSISKILPYFLSSKDGEYEIIDTYLEHFNLQYGYSKN